MQVTTEFKYKAIAIGTTCIIGWACCFLTMDLFREYSFGLFMWLPLVMGLANALLYGIGKLPFTKKINVQLIFITLGIFYLGLLFFAMEGIICMIMAAPIGLLLFIIGHAMGRRILKTKSGQQNITTILIVFILSVPGVMAFDTIDTKGDLRTVTTTIEINATQEAVWRNVISFPQLKDPTEFIFKTGLAYPINATITGHGVGAVRHCNFSTGTFVEPITVWNEPNLLQFSVEEQPEPMKELSPYNIHPNHLHGYWISKQGQFKLTTLPNGHKLLVGTTWYVNKIKPDFYWSVWSDYIVHKIHERVLEHIKIQSEMGAEK